MAGRSRKAVDEIDDTEEIEQGVVEVKASAPIEADDPDKKVSIKKGGVTRIRRIGDLGPYINDGWVRV